MSKREGEGGREIERERREYTHVHMYIYIIMSNTYVHVRMHPQSQSVVALNQQSLLLHVTVTACHNQSLFSSDNLLLFKRFMPQIFTSLVLLMLCTVHVMFNFVLVVQSTCACKQIEVLFMTLSHYCFRVLLLESMGHYFANFQ